MIDLHCHSTASDGTLTPAELVDAAMTSGLQAVALTDHDTTDGLDEFLAAAADKPDFLAIPGIELSCQASTGDNCHIVGLFVDPSCPELIALTAQIRARRDERNVRMLARLVELGMPLTMEEVVACSGGDVIGRPHFAQALIARGYCRNPREAFQNLLGRGRPAYSGRTPVPAAECLAVLRQASAVTVWAHPMTCCAMTTARCRKVVQELQANGLDGIEAYYTDHTGTQTQAVLDIARENGLLVSGGSDFHGTNLPDIALGRGRGNGFMVPAKLLPPICERAGRALAKPAHP
ncbi:MAG TPA: PHP domain-containing protein [Lentisphaeria bacterium]|nr:PHP domain-containing protein [Lentisphaerota bacterium]HPY89137.1 PHP domain-containing protein [Lentisphaeria bacterium]HQC53376.1 PHP domain-containing protein [Lentisphaeria bacterium]HQL88498.1 PHP domain-containing protein [Lentisphaeria bacterium]